MQNSITQNKEPKIHRMICVFGSLLSIVSVIAENFGKIILIFIGNLIQFHQNRLKPGLKSYSLMCQFAVLSVFVHQFDLQLLFQRLYCFTDRWLGNMKILGSHRNIAISCCLCKIFKLI